MAKAGMSRPDTGEEHSKNKNRHSRNDVTSVPEIQGKAKAGHRKITTNQ